MTVVILVFVIGYLAGRLAEARRYNRLALPASAPVVELPEPESVTAAPVVIVETPAKTTQEPQETPSTDVEPLTDKEQARRRREAERAAKMEYERQQAQLDMEHLETMREGYIALYDTLESELTDTTITDRRRTQLQRQILVLEEKLYQVEKKRNKAYFIIHSAV